MDRKRIAEMLAQTWVGRLGNSALEAAKLPGDVYAGRVAVSNDKGRTNPEVIERAADLAGMVTLGSGMVPAAPNTMRAGMGGRQGIAEILASAMAGNAAALDALQRAGLSPPSTRPASQ